MNRLSIERRSQIIGALVEGNSIRMVRIHKSLRVTPAMAAGVSDRLWSLQELVEETSR